MKPEKIPVAVDILAHALARRIDATIDRLHSVGRDNHEEIRRLDDELNQLRRSAAERFARSRGWIVSERQFSTAALARQSPRDVRGPWWDHAAVDHLTFFRGERGRAAALGSQPYQVPADADQWAADNGLVIERPDYPGWHWPRKCPLILFRPAALAVKETLSDAPGSPQRGEWAGPVAVFVDIDERASAAALVNVEAINIATTGRELDYVRSVAKFARALLEDVQTPADLGASRLRMIGYLNAAHIMYEPSPELRRVVEHGYLDRVIKANN